MWGNLSCPSILNVSVREHDRELRRLKSGWETGVCILIVCETVVEADMYVWGLDAIVREQAGRCEELRKLGKSGVGPDQVSSSLSDTDRDR